MDIQPIYIEDDYQAALKIVSKLVDLDPELGTPEADQLGTMGLLIMTYEGFDSPQSLQNQ